MRISAIAKRIGRLVLLAAGVGLAAPIAGSVIAEAAPIRYCGDYSYEWWGSPQTASSSYNASIGLCEVVFDRDNNPTVDNFALPRHVTSVGIVAVGAGGSGAMDATNWSNYIFSQGTDDFIVSTDSGGGGGGGAIWETSGYSVNSNYRFTLSIGEGGRIAPYGGALGQGYMGNDGGDTTIAINNGSTTTTLTAGGGRAPNPQYNSGAGGTASPASFSGWWKNSGTAGRALSSSYSDTYPLSGYWVNGNAPFGDLSQGGGGAAYNDYQNVYSAGQRAATYGSGGGGGMINNGAWSSEDLACFVFGDNRCDGRNGVVRFTWAALDYEPASPVDLYTPVQLTGDGPKVGNTITTYQAFNGSPTPTITYQWFRCTSQTYDSPQTTLPAGCTSIAGATGNSYTVVSADLGKYLVNRVTATNSGTSGTTTISYYTPSSNVAVNTPAAPTLGAATVLGPSSVRFAYTPAANWGEWRGYTVKVTTGGTTVDRAGTYNSANGTLTITGLTANTAYTFQALEYNQDAGNGALSGTQSATTVLAVTSSGAPTITGPDFRSGKTVTFTGGTWSGNSAPTVTSQFFYCTSAQTALYQSEGSAPTAGCTAFDVVNPTTVTLPAAAAARHLILLQTATDSYSTAYYRSASTLITGEWDAPTINRNERVNGWPERITIFWNWPAFKGCNATPSHARYIVSSDGGATWSAPVSFASGGSSYIVTSGLVLGNTYSFRISQGVTCNGTTFYSGYSEITTRTLEEPRVETAPALSGVPTIGATFSITGGTYSGGAYAGRTTVTPNTIRWYACTNSRATAYFGGDLSWVSLNCTQITGQTTSTLATTYAQFGNSAARLHLTAMLNVADNYATYYYIFPTSLMSRVPSAPTAVNFDTGTVTSTSLPVSWTASQFAGAATISGYKVSYSQGPSFSTWSTPAAIGSTNTNYTITGLTAGAQYKVRVLATNSIGDSAASADSVAIATYQAPAISGIPTISGTVAIGQTLTGVTSGLTVTGNPTPTLTYAWYACDTTGDAATLTGTCAAIAGETSTTLTVAASQSQKYLVFRVSATNAVSTVNARSAASVQVPGTPSAVTAVTPSATGTTSISVSFAAPTDTGGGSIVEYQYKYAAAPYSSYSAWSALPDLSLGFSITGLTPNTSYKVIVRAVNAIGAGAESAASATVTTLGAPQIAGSLSLAGTAHVGQVLTATETGGLFTGNPAPTISSRTWYACPTSKNAGDALSDCSAIAGASTTTFTVTSAQVSSYLVYAAVGSNSVASATASSASSAIVANVPAAPSINLVALNGSGSASITISAGAANNSAITGYEYELGGSGTWVSTGSGTSTTFTVTGLTNGQVTNLKVRALNTVGASIGSSTFALTTLAAPGAPSATRTDSGLNVSWTALAGATSYSLSISTQAGSGFATVAGDCGSVVATSCAITGLTNGQAYYLRVVAANTSGSSPLSAVAGPFTPLSQDTTLSALVLRAKTSNVATAIGSALSPAFAGATRSYSAEVASNNQFVTFTPTRSVTGQVIKVNGTVVASGAQSADLAISFGANSFTIEVQSVEKVADASSTAVASYTISVTRANPDMSGFTSFATTDTAASPITSTYTALGITAVNNSNLASINSAIAALPASLVDSPAEIQALVNSYVAILGQSIGGTPTTTPTASDYANLGISTVSSFTSPQVTYLNQVIASLATAEVATVADVARIANAIQNVYLVAAGSQIGASAITVEQLAAIGVIGVTQANLADVVAALAATADDGSGINTIAKIQGIVNTVKAASVTAIASASAQAAPTASTFAAAGVVGVSADNLAAVNQMLATLPSTAKDSTAEIQDAVNSMTLILAQATGASASLVQSAIGAMGVASVASGPTAANFAAIGASTAASLSSAGISLLNSVIGVMPVGSIDSPVEINSLAAAVSTIQTNAAAASVSDFASIGLRGVTASNLSTVRTLLAAAASSAKDSLAEIQAIIDNSATVAVTTAFANTIGSPAVAPTVQDFLGLGVVGVSTANVNALNLALQSTAAAANPPGSWVATQAAIQAVVNSLSSASVTVVSAYSGSGSAPAVSDYQALGVVGVKASNIAALNEIVAALPSTATDSPAEVQQVVTAYIAVVNTAKSGQATALKLADLQALGITGVNATNFAAIAEVIAQAAAADVDSIVEIQSIVAAAITQASTSISAITSFASNPATAPELAVYKAAGVVGVTQANKALIDQALATANPSPSTPAEVQAIINAVVAAPIALISGENSIAAVRTADFALAGITGVTSSNRDDIVELLAALPSASRDSVLEVQKAIDSFLLVVSAARGESNSGADAAKPTPADFAAIGVDLGPIANDTEAFAFFISVLSKLPAEVAASPAALTERAAIVSDLLRAASNKEPVATLTPEKFAAIGMTGVTTTNVQQVLTEMAAAPSGQNGLIAIEAAAVRYAVPIAAPVVTPTPTPTPTNPGVDPTPTPTPTPTVPVKPVVVPVPTTVSFAAGSTALSAGAKKVVESQVTKLLKANVKTVTVQSVVTLPKNASTAWRNQVLTAAKARAAAVAKVASARAKALGSKAKVVTRVVTTTKEGVRDVKISGK